MDKKLIIGAHLSIVDGFASSIDAAESIGATALQIFTKSNRSWFAPKIAKQEADLFKARVEKSSVKAVVVHAGYLINLASSKQEVAQKSTKSLAAEMQRCADLEIKDLILHPGAHTGQGVAAGIAQAAGQLNQILKHDTTGTRVLLETMAGQGSCIGATFAELAAFFAMIDKKEQVGFCLDTCHIFSAGYDLVSAEGFAKTMHELEQLLKIENIKAIQLNDSKFELGSKKDRHENLGLGKIGKAGLTNFVQHPAFAQIPMLLETPVTNGLAGYAEEIKRANQWTKL